MSHKSRNEQKAEQTGWKIPKGLSDADWQLLWSIASEQEINQRVLHPETHRQFIQQKKRHLELDKVAGD